MKKGLVWMLILPIIIMIILIVYVNRYIIDEQLLNKRALEERMLATGNEIETYTRIIDSSADLAIIQAIHDVGHNSVVYGNYEYDPNNYLPYWDSIPKDEIKKEISDLSLIYLKNYEIAYDNYFDERNKNPGNENIDWILTWSDSEPEIIFDENKIESNFGISILIYKSSDLYVTKEFPIESSINTNFIKIFDVGNEVISAIKSGESEKEIESWYKSEIKVELEQQNDFVKVFVYDDKLYPLYDPLEDETKLNYLGLKFLVDIGSPKKVSSQELSYFRQCGIISKNENICELYLTR